MKIVDVRRHSLLVPAIVALTAWAIVCLSGCGGSLGRATGKVTLNGQPVKDADVIFAKEDDPDERYTGLSFDGGEYQVDYGINGGLIPGRYTVTVTRYTQRNGQPLPSGEEGEALKAEGRAIRKTATFTKDISPGTNHIDFELSKSEPAAGR